MKTRIMIALGTLFATGVVFAANAAPTQPYRGHYTVAVSKAGFAISATCDTAPGVSGVSGCSLEDGKYVRYVKAITYSMSQTAPVPGAHPSQPVDMRSYDMVQPGVSVVVDGGQVTLTELVLITIEQAKFANASAVQLPTTQACTAAMPAMLNFPATLCGYHVILTPVAAGEKPDTAVRPLATE